MTATDCGCDGCCAGTHPRTPRAVDNPPGLPAIARRVGTHADFLATMLAGIGRQEALRDLATRTPDDLTIALLDAWATVADVLTFYQERIGTESYRRIATERRSLYELARLIGYQPGPGLAAAVDLAFTLDAFPGAPPVHTVLAAGLKVQSVPVADEPAQIFETVETVTARSEWNALLPRLRQPIPLTPDPPVVTVAAGPVVTPGDPVLVVPSTGTPTLHTVLAVRPDAAASAVTLVFETGAIPPPLSVPDLPAGTLTEVPGPALDDAAVAAIRVRAWSAADIDALCRLNGWAQDDLARALNTAVPVGGGQVLVLRQRAAVFGHNAPKYDSLPFNLRYKTTAKVRSNGTDTDQAIAAAFPDSWEERTLEADANATDAGRTVFLDNTYPAFVPGSWAVLVASTGSGSATLPLTVLANVTTTRTNFTLSARVSRLLLDGHEALDPPYFMRTTTVLGGGEALTLAPSAVTDDVSGDRITLDGAYLGLSAGRTVALTGRRRDLPGVDTTELRLLADAQLADGYTVLVLDTPLGYAYLRETVRINANVAAATHGETRTEILGSGDASQAFARFTLKQPPLTYVGSTAATGVASTLSVYVNDVRWTEVPQLLGAGPTDRVYRTFTDDTGATVVQFGDGRTGARPPTGTDNIRAVYRRGTGLAGLVPAGRLTTPLSHPLGLSGVTNPLPPAGAADPESLDEIRDNLPLRVLTMDRVVSLRDHEDFSRSFAGVAKALAVEIWDGQRRVVAVTVAGPQGAAIAPDSTVHGNLTAALRAAGDPHRPVSVTTYRPALFRLDATLTYDPAYQPDLVRAAVVRALASAFGFAARTFAQPVALSEVIGVIHAVPGVAAVDVNELYRTDVTPVHHPEPLLPAAAPLVGLAAELLTIDPAGITVR